MSPPYIVVDAAKLGGVTIPSDAKMTNEIPAKEGDQFEVFKNGVARVAGPFGFGTAPPTTDPPDPPTEEPQPPIVLPPEVGDGMFRPTNENELFSVLQDAANTSTIAVLHPKTKVTLSKTMVINCKGNDGSPWGVVGNGAKIIWGGADGGRALIYRGEVADWDHFRTNRGLLIEKLFLDGQGKSGDLLTLEAMYGDPGSIYKSVLRDIYCVYSGANGITYRGAIFESYLDNPHAENCLGHGMETIHDDPGTHGMRGIISNINIVHPNFSRNKKAGLKCMYSTNAILGSFVLNADGGVVAPQGLRVGFANNGENTGEAVYDVPSNGYGSYILYSEGSSDGQTHHRQFEDGKWVSYGKPQLYTVSKASGVTEVGNHIATYGPGEAMQAAGIIRAVK